MVDGTMSSEEMGTIVTLLTDFGTADGYVGAMRGVILSRAPNAQIVDLTHDIAPQDVRAGAWALRQASRTFPAGTIHVGVVDPGVGTERRAIAVEQRGTVFIGPDNGLLSLAVPAGDARVYALDDARWFRQPLSATFHGRDVFAAVAGHIAAGVEVSRCGSRCPTWVRLSWPEPTWSSSTRIAGEVAHIDRFGNLISNIPAEMLGATGSSQPRVALAARELGPLRTTYGEVEAGAWVAYVGSAGLLEIAVRDASAAATGAGLGDSVRVRWDAEDGS